MEYIGAYLVRGGEMVHEALIAQLAKHKVIERGHPDLFEKKYRAFGVAEAEDLRSRARMRAIAGTRRVFVLHVPAITTEAQNALLKTLEEPAADALFFVVVPSPDVLLPTIRSRVQFLRIDAASELDGVVPVDAFLAASPDARITMLKPFYDSEDEGRDIGGVIAFLQALEHRFAKSLDDAGARAGLRAVYRARKYVGDKGSLLKSLLEQVALLAPKL